MLCSDHEGVHPDILVLGKALSGGTMPVSAVLANDDIMLCIKPGQHGSTFGGNPVACAVAVAALRAIKEEGMIENARKLGEVFRAEMRKMQYPWIVDIRGKGLLNAIEMNPSHTSSAWDICLKLKEKGVLSKPTHDHIIRFSPPLVITEAELLEACNRIRAAFAECV